MSGPANVAPVNVTSPVVATPPAPTGVATPALGESGASLLARALLEPQISIDSRRSSVNSNAGDPAPPSPASRARASSRAVVSDHSPAAERNMAELNDMMAELHRNQLWFTYVLASTREGFQSGPLAAADSIAKNTLDELSLALETTKESKRRMIDIQRRVDAVKNTVGGWRQKQIAEAQAIAATKEAKAAAAAASAQPQAAAAR